VHHGTTSQHHHDTVREYDMGCMHRHYPGERRDPARCDGTCPVCGAGVGSEPGQPTTIHQETGTLDTCPGSGQPAQ
jgi:hypothetical protein